MEYEVIELGGGENPLYRPNLDITLFKAVDIVCDLTKGIPLPDSSVGKIYSQDFLEHLSFRDCLHLLGECNRILRKGGEIEFITPDIEKTLFTHSSFNEHVHHMVVGDDYIFRCKNWNEGRPELRHRMWFSPDLITYILTKEGWLNIIISEYRKDPDYWKEPKMRVVARKP